MAGQRRYVIMKWCQGGRPPDGRGGTRCGSPCRARRLARQGSGPCGLRASPRRTADPAIASAEIASELRRGANYVRVTVVTAGVADALAIAWDAFRSAARDDLSGWEVTAAAAQVQPEPPLTGGDGNAERRYRSPVCRHAARARYEIALQVHPGGEAEHIGAFLVRDRDHVLGAALAARPGPEAAGPAA